MRVLSEHVGGLRLVGLDVDPMETALAVAEGLYERVHTAPAASIPEPDASFDFVVSISVMEHIRHLEPVLSDVARVLKPNGQLISTAPGPGFHACLRGALIPGTARDAYLAALDRRLAHLRYWSTADWRSALEAAGLKLLEARPILSRRDVRRWETISRLTGGVLHALSGGKPPIEIQRSLGWRQAGQRRLPAPVARVMTGLLAFGLDGTPPSHERESGCLLVTATCNREK
jgi:SAM-dependent methyltransferase